MSGLLLIVRRSLRHYALSSCITALSVALAAGLLMAVFSIQAQTYEAFTGGPIGFDAVFELRAGASCPPPHPPHRGEGVSFGKRRRLHIATPCPLVGRVGVGGPAPPHNPRQRTPKLSAS